MSPRNSPHRALPVLTLKALLRPIYDSIIETWASGNVDVEMSLTDGAYMIAKGHMTRTDREHATRLLDEAKKSLGTRQRDKDGKRRAHAHSTLLETQSLILDAVPGFRENDPDDNDPRPGEIAIRTAPTPATTQDDDEDET